MSKDLLYPVNGVSKTLLLALQEAQSKFGNLPEAALVEVADSFSVPLSYVYGIASFYSFLKIKSPGKNVIRICRSLPCYLKNSQVVVETIAKEIGCKPGDTNHNGRFSFELTNCIGLCDRAPAMLINNDPHVDLTPAKISSILKGYK